MSECEHPTVIAGVKCLQCGIERLKEEVKGKAYANRLPTKKRPEGDFYPTPKSLVWVANTMLCTELDKQEPVFEPCAGTGVLSNELKRMGFSVVENDITYGFDYLNTECYHNQIVTNPPFSMWDEFVLKAKREASKVIMIGRLNYLGTHSRFTNNVWDELKAVYCFDRYVDYRTPERDDGLFHVGAMATAWFVWEKGYTGKPMLDILSVQEYAKLGNMK